jgi:AraC-like DNA-binding protein
MPTRLDTLRIPRVERIAAAAAFLSAAIDLPSALSFDDGEQLGHRMTGWPLAGGARIIDVEGSGLRVAREKKHVRASAPERLCLSVQFRGEGRSEHRGLVALTPPGHLNLVDCTSESVYLWTGPAARRICVIDYSTLGLPVDVVRAAVGRLTASPLHDLVRSHLRALQPRHEDLRATAAGMALAAGSVELIRALITTAAEPAMAREADVHDILRASVADFIERHHSDAKLNAETIARAHHISVRHLYAVWSVNSVPLREWIIRTRLERARRELATSASTPVSAVSGRCGFADVTHFSRRFRDAYGMSPNEWRRHFFAFP